MDLLELYVFSLVFNLKIPHLRFYSHRVKYRVNFSKGRFQPKCYNLPVTDNRQTKEDEVLLRSPIFVVLLPREGVL